jgi:hypothetical protein
MNALARVSGGSLNVNYMLGKSDFMLIDSVPDDEFINLHNPDIEVIKKRKLIMEQPTSNLDSSSVINMLIANHTHQINMLEKEMADRLADKDTLIESLQRTIADKEEIIKARDARIVALERQLADVASSDLSRYPFTIGAAEGDKMIKTK